MTAPTSIQPENTSEVAPPHQVCDKESTVDEVEQPRSLQSSQLKTPISGETSMAMPSNDNTGNEATATLKLYNATATASHQKDGDDQNIIDSATAAVRVSEGPQYAYKDYATMQNPNPSVSVMNTNKPLTFPLKLHIMLSRPESQGVVTWIPHGRAWRIVSTKAFKEQILPLFFGDLKYRSFIRQINGYGFQRLHQGADRNSYFHEVSTVVLYCTVACSTRSSWLQETNGLYCQYVTSHFQWNWPDWCIYLVRVCVYHCSLTDIHSLYNLCFT